MPMAFAPSTPAPALRRSSLGGALQSGRRRLAARAPASRSRARVVVAIRTELGEPLGDGNARFGPTRWGEGIVHDLRRRAPLYRGDWTDGFSSKTLPTIMFLYFACLAPVVAFGALTSVLTEGAIGVVEFLISSSVGGMFYALTAGQPLTIIAPTGLTLAFTSSLYVFCQRYGFPFLPTYSWVGIWTGIILAVLSFINSSDIIRHCTRFTDDVFNSLIATNFLYEAVRSLGGNFSSSAADKTKPFMALSLGLGTYIIGRSLSEFRRSRYLRRSVRTFVADFGPSIAIITMSALAALPVVSYVGLETLTVPSKLSLANNRPWLIPLHLASTKVRLLAIIPAMLLVCLFWLDQNITVRVVNAPQHELQKGPGYHLDMLILAICTVASSLVGLPWMCAATPQSLNHIRALSNVSSPATDQPGERSREVVDSVVETRLTGFCIHAAIGGSFVFLGALKKIPMAVIAGLFLYLGRNMMTGNEFLRRIRLFFVDPNLYPSGSPLKSLRPFKVHLFTFIQLLCLIMLWVLKVNRRTSLFFPTVIGTLMVIRSFLLVRFFSQRELDVLDSEVELEAEESMNVVDSGLAVRHLDEPGSAAKSKAS